MRVRRWVLVLFGVVLVFVPTAFGVFVEWTEWSPRLRGAVLIGWVIVAALVVWGSVVQGEQVERILGNVRRRRNEGRELAARRLLGSLLKCGTGLPDHYLFRVFVYDEDTDRLTISYDPVGLRASTTAWKPGQGATGAAWERKKYVLAEGEKVADETFGLTPAQQRRYKDLKVVAAMPVYDERGKVIAILTGSSKVDDGALVSPDGFTKHTELAAIVGRVLADLAPDEDV
jgi:hypothetical protein